VINNLRLEVFQEKKFCKPKTSVWEKLFQKNTDEDNFKETPYFSGDMGCMFLLLNNLKKWHNKVKGKKVDDPEDRRDSNEKYKKITFFLSLFL